MYDDDTGTKSMIVDKQLTRLINHTLTAGMTIDGCDDDDDDDVDDNDNDDDVNDDGDDTNNVCMYV